MHTTLEVANYPRYLDEILNIIFIMPILVVVSTLVCHNGIYS